VIERPYSTPSGIDALQSDGLSATQVSIPRMLCDAGQNPKPQESYATGHIFSAVFREVGEAHLDVRFVRVVLLRRAESTLEYADPRPVISRKCSPQGIALRRESTKLFFIAFAFDVQQKVRVLLRNQNRLAIPISLLTSGHSQSIVLSIEFCPCSKTGGAGGL